MHAHLNRCSAFIHGRSGSVAWYSLVTSGLVFDISASYIPKAGNAYLDAPHSPPFGSQTGESLNHETDQPVLHIHGLPNFLVANVPLNAGVFHRILYRFGFRDTGLHAYAPA